MKVNKKILNERYDFRIEPFQKKDGTQGKKLYLVGDANENTYQIKDIIKQNGFRFDGNNKQWYIFLSNDDSKNNYIIDKFVRPLIDKITQIEDNGQGGRNPEDVTNNLKGQIIKQIDQVITSPVSSNTNIPTANEVKDHLAAYKQELVKITSSDEFKKRLEPIIKFRQAQGHSFSLLNCILVWIQDPKARLVKSSRVWKDYYNKTVIPGSPAIYLWCPIGANKLTKTQKEQIQADFIRAANKNSYEELTPGEKDELRVRLLGNSNSGMFALQPFFYDIRYTKQIEGTEDVTGDPNASIDWFSEGDNNENTAHLYDSLLQVIESTGIKLGFVNDLGGARGVSKSGNIDILKTGTKSSGTIITIVHEFAHELLHQKYLKQNKDYSQYFIGTSQGRRAVEQQAELTAWIVMKEFNYDMPTATNYMGIWGMDENNAAKVFNDVASVSTFIINKLYLQLSSNVYIQESSGYQPKQVNITGLDVARMIGMEDVYQRSLENQKKNFTEKYFSNLYNRMNNLKTAAE